MSLYHFRRRINALQRKLAVPLSVVRLRPLAEDYCDQWVSAVADGRETPPATPEDAPCAGDRKARPLMDRVVAAGFRLTTWLDLQRHVRRCRENCHYPHPDNIMRVLLPKAASLGFIPKSPPPVSY